VDYTPGSVGGGSHLITAAYGGDANFTSSNGNQSVTVNKKALTVTGITASNKVYNGNATAVVNTLGATLVGNIDGGNLTLNVGGAAGAFSDENVGTGKTVQISGLTLSGAAAGNYTLTQPTTTADITQRDLTVTATAANKVYDGTPAATVTLSTDALGGDAVTAAYTSAVFVDKNVGIGKSVSVSGLTIGGADAGNYNLLSATAAASANITAKDLTVTGITAQDKAYDGTTVATLNLGSAALVGNLDGGNVTLNTSGAVGTFSDANAGSGKTVQVSGLTLNGTESGNYNLIQPTTTASIFTAGGAISKWTSSFDTSHGWTVKDYVRMVGDVNGDEKDDLVGFGLDGVYVALSNGSSFDPIGKWSSSFDLSHGWTVSQYVRTVGDVNGDGKADAVGFGLDGVYVALSNGASFGPISKWTSAFDSSHGWTVKDYVRTVGDVNGDGKADLVGFGLDGVYVALANASGDGFDPVSKWTSSFDLSHGWTVKDYVRTVGDVNNDDKADLVGFGLDGVYVALSNGAGFDPVSKWTSSFDTSHGWTVKDYVRTVGDINGDGNMDLVGFGLDGVYVAFSNGTSFGPISKWTSSFDLSHGWTVKDYVRTVGDVDGDLDGKDDLVGFGLDGVYVILTQ